MKIRLTNPAMLDKVLTKLDKDWPIGKENQTFLKYCVEPLKEKVTIQRTRRCSRLLEKGEDCVVGRVAVLLGCLDD